MRTTIRNTVLVLIVALSFMLSSAAIPASAQGASPAEVYEKLFATRPLQAKWFTEQFLAQVPLTQIEAMKQL